MKGICLNCKKGFEYKGNQKYCNDCSFWFKYKRGTTDTKKHLIKNNKRRCYICKEIKDLDKNNFGIQRSNSTGFSYLCKKCSMKKKN